MTAICPTCGGSFTAAVRPTRTQVCCSKHCAQLGLARTRGRAFYRRMAKRAWTPEKRQARTMPPPHSADYKKGYSAGWVACERFWRQRKTA